MNFRSRCFCKEWTLAIALSFNDNMPKPFLLTAQEYNDGTEIRIEYLHDETYDGCGYDKYEIPREEKPLTAQKLLLLFKEYMAVNNYECEMAREIFDTEYNFSGKNKMTAKIKDQRVAYRFEFQNIKQGHITPYALEVCFSKDASGNQDIWETVSVGDEKITIGPLVGLNAPRSVSRERLSLLLAKSFSDTLLEEVPSLIPAPSKPKGKPKGKPKRKPTASSSGAIAPPEDADEGGDKDG